MTIALIIMYRLRTCGYSHVGLEGFKGSDLLYLSATCSSVSGVVSQSSFNEKRNTTSLNSKYSLPILHAGCLSLNGSFNVLIIRVLKRKRFSAPKELSSLHGNVYGFLIYIWNQC